MRGNIGRLLLGNGLGQVIQFSAILIFSRIYTPIDFGILGQVQSYATIMAIVCTLQMHLSIPLSKTDHDARAVVSIIVAIALLAVICSLPLALYFGSIYAFAVGMAALVGLSNTYNSYLVYSGRFAKISKFYIFRSIAIVSMQITLGYAQVNNGLIWGAVAGEAITAFYLARTAGAGIVQMKFWRIGDIVHQVLDKRDFAVFGTLQEIISVSAFYAPLFLFAHYFGNDVAGQYAMASRLIWAPVILFTGSFAQVLYHDFGKKANSLLSFDMLIFPHPAYYCCLLLIPLMFFLLNDVAVILLGSQWTLAADLLPLVVLWGCIFIVSTPWRVLCRMTRKQRVHLIIDAGMLLGIAAVFYIRPDSPLHTMLLIVGIVAVQNILMFITAFYSVKASLLEAAT